MLDFKHFHAYHGWTEVENEVLRARLILAAPLKQPFVSNNMENLDFSKFFNKKARGVHDFTWKGHPFERQRGYWPLLFSMQITEGCNRSLRSKVAVAKEFRGKTP